MELEGRESICWFHDFHSVNDISKCEAKIEKNSLARGCTNAAGFFNGVL